MWAKKLNKLDDNKNFQLKKGEQGSKGCLILIDQ